MPRLNQNGPAYARLAGEFAVIVMGVLVALAADRWGESRGNAARRDQYLQNLIADVKADTLLFSRAGRQPTDWRASLVLHAARGGPIYPDSVPYFLYAVESLQWYNPPLATRETFDDLVNTGNLTLLAPEARRVLAEYYNRVSAYEQREELFRGVLIDGYRHAPSVVLGPELHPRVYDLIQAQRDQRKPDLPIMWRVDDVQIEPILRRLRGIPQLESWVAERMYVDRQHSEIYGDRLYRLGKDLLRILEGVAAGTIARDSVRFSAEGLRQ